MRQMSVSLKEKQAGISSENHLKAICLRRDSLSENHTLRGDMGDFQAVSEFMM